MPRLTIHGRIPGVVRRLFTVASVLAFALLTIVRLLGVGDPRYVLFGFGFILHPENRMAVRFPGGKLWAFNYSAAYRSRPSGLVGTVRSKLQRRPVFFF